MSERDLLNAPKTYALLRTLEASGVDVRPYSPMRAALLNFARVEATKATEIVKEFQRANPITIEVKTSGEARRLIDTVSANKDATIKALAEAVLRNGFWVDGGKDWHSRRCPQSLPPTGAPCTCPDDRSALHLTGRL